LVLVALVTVLVLAACAPNPKSLIISPQLGEQMAALEAGNEVVRAEPTPAPKLADLAPDQLTAGLSEDLIAALASADPARGEQLAVQNGCVGCHSLDPNATMTGPTWYNVGNTAVSRVPGESPALYLDTSIVNPGGFVVSGYPSGVMPATYKDTLSIQDQADLLAHLLAQTQE
jgi:cytochrome c551/c552